MAWWANQVFAEPTQSVISAFCSVSSLSNGLYLVDNLKDYNWWRDEHRHNLPPNGLLILRELNAIQDGDDEPEVVFWDDVVGPPTTKIIGVPEVLSSDVPPVDFLRFLKWVSQSTETTVSFYHCVTWAGSIDFQFAWIFSSVDSILVLDETGSISEYNEAGRKTILNGSVLPLVLHYYGINLSPSGYFALHARGFNWEKYKIQCSGW